MSCQILTMSKNLSQPPLTRETKLSSRSCDSGCRIGELLTLRIKNIQFDDYGGVLLVTGKTGQRRVRIIHSVQRLQTWLDQPPSHNNPEAVVFCSISNKSKGAQLSYEAVSRLLFNLLATLDPSCVAGLLQGIIEYEK